MSQKFHWNAEPVEALSSRCTHITLGLMGLALMLMMMNLSSAWALAPGVLVVLITRRAQLYYEQLQETFDDSSLELSPRTLAINKPACGDEKRIRYRDISQLASFKKWGINGLRIQMENGEAIELCGYPTELEATLKDAIEKA